jgi:hypothetical protein
MRCSIRQIASDLNRVPQRAGMASSSSRRPIIHCLLDELVERRIVRRFYHVPAGRSHMSASSRRRVYRHFSYGGSTRSFESRVADSIARGIRRRRVSVFRVFIGLRLNAFTSGEEEAKEAALAEAAESRL